MSSILSPLITRLRVIPASHWEAIAKEAGCAKSLPRKLVSGERTNPTVQTIQPLIDYLDDVDAGRRKLPRAVLRALAESTEMAQRAPKGE